MSSATAEAVDDRSLLPKQKSDIGVTRPDSHTGLLDWLTTVDHKKIGIMYGLSALFFFLVGGLEALIIRLQLAVPQNDFISASDLQSDVHDAWDHDGIPCRHAHGRRLF